MNIDLTASDGHRFGAWLSEPSGHAPRGGLVVLQEIFGINAHMRSVADGYAADGWLVVAPALFDRAERGVDLVADDAGIQRGVALKSAVGNDKPLLDIAAAIERVAGAGKVGIVGYCWGGLLSWLAACKLDGLAAAVPYYGGGVPQQPLELKPRCPVLAHFGEKDPNIPADAVREWHRSYPQVELHFYDAGHGFNRGGSKSHHEPSARLARERTHAFLGQYLA
jgi:carboxymethylenebutenolidase